MDEEWRIHSLQLRLTRQSQMELIDTLDIEQLYRPVDDRNWFIASQVVYPSIRFLGFDAWGSFVNVYSEVNTAPVFSKGVFGNTILAYRDSANRRSLAYWEENRPIPLNESERKDYLKKDSLESLRRDPHYLDSLERRRNRPSALALLLLGQEFSHERRRVSLSVSPLIEQVHFNPAEGWLINTGLSWSKRWDSSGTGRRQLTLSPVIRYGFANKHLNAWLTAQYNYGRKYISSIRVSGGKRVFPFSSNSPIGETGNTLSCLLYEENRIKSYEAAYFRASLRKGIGDGFSWEIGFQYQDRKPLDNRTDYT